MNQDFSPKPRLIVMGSYVTDLMGRAQHIPIEGETVKGKFFKTGPGGKGGNQAVAAARAGGRVAMITKVGTDVFGDMAYENFINEGIDARYVIRTSEFATGAALIMVSEETGQNSIIVIPGACENIKAEEVQQAISALLPADIMILKLETNIEAIGESLRISKLHNIKVVMNPAPAQEIPGEYYAMIDYLTPNESEASALSGIDVVSISSARRAAFELQKRGCRNVVVTLGGKGAVALDEKGHFYHVPSFNVKVIDTTGAGDAFNGALALALGERRSLEDAIVFASAAAALSVTRVGTAPAMADRQEIDEFLKKNHISVREE